MKTLLQKLHGFTLVAIAAFALPAHATNPTEVITNVSSSSSSGIGGSSVGWKFSLSQDILVTDLGLSGFSLNNVDHAVSIWTDSGTLLASVQVNPLTAALSANGFYYTALPTELALGPGASYWIGTYYANGGGELVLANASYTLDSAVTFEQAGLAPGSAIPNQYTQGSMVFMSTNFKYAVPEPSTYALTGVGLLALGFLRRKKA